MANSWANPLLANTIANDVPNIQAALSALATLDPGAISAGLPSGAKRLATVTDGVQFQTYNGSAWASVGKLIHDADTVDGYHATVTANKNTIAVRNNKGHLEGNITGNAVTATTASGIDFVVSLSQGGTGATSAVNARNALGAAPKNHSSTSTDYGPATDTKYGHVKLTDDYTGGEQVASGIALTPKALADAVGALTGTQEGFLPLTGGTLKGNLTLNKKLIVAGDSTFNNGVIVAGGHLKNEDDAQIGKSGNIFYPAMTDSEVYCPLVNISLRAFLVDGDTKSTLTTQRADNVRPFRLLVCNDNPSGTNPHSNKSLGGFAIDPPNACIIASGGKGKGLVHTYALNGETNVLTSAADNHIVLAASQEVKIVTHGITWDSRFISKFGNDGALYLGGSGCRDGVTDPADAVGALVLSPRSRSGNRGLVSSTIPGYIYGDAPSNHIYQDLISIWSVGGKNSAGATVAPVAVSRIEVTNLKNGSNSIDLILRNQDNTGWVSLGLFSTGVAHAPTPPASSNGYYIATTQWVRERIGGRLAVSNDTITVSDTYDGTLVHKTGNETIGGAKVFTSAAGIQVKSGIGLTIKCTGFSRSVQPDGVYDYSLLFLSSNGSAIGNVYGQYSTDRSTFMGLYSYNGTTTSAGNNVHIGVGFDGNGKWYTYAPQPDDLDATTKIPTTAWVQTAISGWLSGSWTTSTNKNGYYTADEVSNSIATAKNACVLLTGNQTISGMKTFNAGSPATFCANPAHDPAYLDHFVLKNNGMESLKAPSAVRTSQIIVTDKSGVNAFGFYFQRNKSGDQRLFLRAFAYNDKEKYSDATLTRLADGTEYFVVPQPGDTANGQEAATCKWVNTKLNSLSSTLTDVAENKRKFYYFTDFAKGTLITDSIYGGFCFSDAHKNTATKYRIADFGCYVNENTAGGVNLYTCAYMMAYSPLAERTEHARIAILYNSEGQYYTEAPTPAATDGGNKIATCDYVKSLYFYGNKLSAGKVTGLLSSAAGIEFNGTSGNNGGYIDFHYKNATDPADFTSRIMESSKGTLQFSCWSSGSSYGTIYMTKNTLYPYTNYDLGSDSKPWQHLNVQYAVNVISDERMKENIEPFSDDVLDAVDEIGLYQFTMKDGKRTHAGIIAQRCIEPFQKHNVDVDQYGFFCYSRWEDQYTNELIKIPAKYDEKGNIVEEASQRTEEVLITKAGDRYSVRYTEFLVMEAAAARRRVKRLEERIRQLEEKLAVA